MARADGFTSSRLSWILFEDILDYSRSPGAHEQPRLQRLLKDLAGSQTEMMTPSDRSASHHTFLAETSGLSGERECRRAEAGQLRSRTVTLSLDAHHPSHLSVPNGKSDQWSPATTFSSLVDADRAHVLLRSATVYYFKTRTPPPPTHTHTSPIPRLP